MRQAFTLLGLALVLAAAGCVHSFHAVEPRERVSQIAIEDRDLACQGRKTVSWLGRGEPQPHDVSTLEHYVSLPAPRASFQPLYVLVECEGAYVAGWPYAGSVWSDYVVLLDKSTSRQHAESAGDVLAVVRDARTDLPVPNVRVFWISRLGLETESVVTDRSGTARLHPGCQKDSAVYLLVDGMIAGYQITGLRCSPGQNEYTISMSPAVLN